MRHVFSNVSIVAGEKRVYIREISKHACYKIHKPGSPYSWAATPLIDGLKKNSTISSSLTFVGALQNDGACQDAMFSGSYGTWENVVVQGSIKITFREFLLPIKLATNQVILPSSIRCKTIDRECQDANGVIIF